ncbi:hypothetical protein BDV19DRAFT_211707 [Aspergillus venezuelensis]
MSSRNGSADTFTQRSASTVRPRRLISFTEDDGGNTIGQQPSSSGLSTMRSSELPSLRARGATPSPRPSRTVSPIPMGHPSRVTQSRGGSRPGNSLGGFYSGKHQDPFAEPSRAAADFLDASWSSLQGIASSLLGSDSTRPTTNGAVRSHARKPSRPDYFSKPRTSSATWGPSGPATPEIGAGTQEERQAMVQAKKMEALLLADTDPSWNIGSKHKRRESNDRPVHTEIDPDHDEEALVYVHQVQPTDSITGVTIRYGCQAAIFRKANGFWPSDSIQGRRTVLLPVDCCSVKGRPVQPDINLLDTPSRPSIEDTSGSSIVPQPTPEASTSKASDTSQESDQNWKHDSWVQIDGFPEPVEIGRVPRRALGFFPRTRRKSIYSDTEPVRGRETTPVFSSASSPIQPTSRNNDCLGLPKTGGPGRPGHRRERSGFEFSGPGVGTLDRNVNLPGPAMDGLSKFFAQHMPTLAPKQAPPNFEDLSGNSSTAASSNSTSLDSIGGAVESWVRKMTARAKSSINELQQGTSSPQTHGLPPQAGRRGFDDLIELDDGLESPSGLLSGPSWKPELTRSGSSYANGANLRGRFPSASPSTSRTRTGLKDD